MYSTVPKFMNPQQGLASLVNSPYGDSDVMRVKMTPREVAGLQQLAISHGATEQDLYDPVTGEPRFSFLKKILPMIAGAVLPGIPVIGEFAKTLGLGNQALGSALLVGGVSGLVEGDLKKGLMAGLGAYSGAKIGEGLTAAGTATSQVSAAPPSTASLKDTAYKISADSVGQDLPLSSLRQTPISEITGKSMIPVQPITQAPPMPVPETTAPTGTFGTMGQGVKNLFASDATGDAARQAFGNVFSNPLVRTAAIAGGLGALTPEQKPMSVPGMGEDTFYVPGAFNPLYGTGINQPQRLPGKYYKRTKTGVVPYNPFGPTGYAAGGMVQPQDASQQQNVPQQQAFPQQETIPHQQQPLYPYPSRSYPLSTVTQPGYSPNAPQGREIVNGYDTKVDPFTGEQKFANGGAVFDPTTGYVDPATVDPNVDNSNVRLGTNLPTGVAPSKPNAPVVVENPNVIANRKYVEELNKRAMKPAFTPYGYFMTGAPGAMGGTNTPWTGTNPYGGALNTMVGNQPATGGSTTDALTNIATMYGLQKGIGALVGTKPVQDFLVKTGLKKAGDVAGTIGSKTTPPGTSPTGTQPAGEDGMFTKAKQQFTDWLGQKGFDVKLPSSPLGYATAAFGAYNTAKAIEQGKEGKAALNAALTAAQFGGPMVAAAAAAVAAIGASLVNTKEYGDVALRNYWDAVDKGRGLGSAPPEELAQGFINFYRTNKNEFPAQAKYGRTGNEDFVYDLTQVVNKAVETGLVPKTASAGEIYQKAVQPWLNSMGSGPKDDDARRIQDFMMTDLIHNFMQGKPISNAQVKGDKKFKIVSEKPVYAGAVTAQPQTQNVANTVQQALQKGPLQGYRNLMNPANPYAGQPVRANRQITEEPMYMSDMGTMTFAEGGSIGEDYNFGFAGGGEMPTEYLAGGKLLNGPGDGMSDDIPAVIRGKGVQRAALADGEFVIPADVVSHLGNGSTKAGANKLYDMMAKVREARTGRTRQAPAVNADRLLPA